MNAYYQLATFLSDLRLGWLIGMFVVCDGSWVIPLIPFPGSSGLCWVGTVYVLHGAGITVLAGR